MKKTLTVPFLVALLLPFTLILGGGFWGGQTQHTHRSAAEGGKISWIPTGFIGCYAGSTPPVNTLETFGQAVSRTTYAGLFSEIGTTYGIGDGVSTFNVPDLRGRIVIGLDNQGGTAANRITSASTGGGNSTTLGGVGGEQTHTLIASETPILNVGIDTTGTGTAASILSASRGNTVDELIPAANASGGGAHSTTQPWIALKCVIGT